MTGLTYFNARVLLTVLVLCLMCDTLHASEPEYMINTVFEQGEYGYHTYRIPAIVMANDGTLLAFAEGRRFSGADHEKNDIVQKRSFDNGNTWSEMTLVQREGDSAFIWIGNPAPVVDRRSGTIHMVFTRNNYKVFHTYSTDNGASWSPRAEILENARDYLSWNWIGAGPGIGIQLERGEEAGRLVIPLHFRYQEDDKSLRANMVAYSDDGGKSWEPGLVIKETNIDLGYGESACVELAETTDDGGSRVYFLSRRNSPTHIPYLRLEGYSHDGGRSATGPYRINRDIRTVRCQGALLRWSSTDQGDHRNRILFSGVSRLTSETLPRRLERKHVAVWSSFDEGNSWSYTPKKIWSSYSAYSSMVKTQTGHLGILFEGGTEYMFYTNVDNRYSEIKFVRINEAWLDMPLTGAVWDFRSLTEADVAKRKIPDLFPDGNHRPFKVYGNVMLTETDDIPDKGRALYFDGRGKLVLPDAETWSQFDFSANDSFTIEVSFRLDSDPDHTGVLLTRSHRDIGHYIPGWKLDLDKSGHARFRLSDDDHMVEVRSEQPMNDGKWHHVAAVRDTSARTISLYVNGKLSAEKPDKTISCLANRMDLIAGASNDLALENFTGFIRLISIQPVALEPSGFFANQTSP
jgi:sialidase-1